MPIITISRGTYTRGKEIAEKLAEKLGYECISRDVLIEASSEFNIPEVKLVRALHDAPSVLSRFTYGKERYIAFIRKALLEAVKDGNVIYHGLAGQFLLKEVPHIFKVRILADIEARIKEEMKRENITEDKARHLLKKDDDERRKWSLALYGIDTTDAYLYDIVLHIDTLTVDDAVDILANAADRPAFRPTPESKKIIDNLVLGAQVQALLVDKYPTVQATNKEGVVYIGINGSPSQQTKIAADVDKLLEGLEGIKEIKTTVVPIVT